jgi:uncharacterized protein (DUF1015 family)
VAEIRPFRGLRYNPLKIGDLSRVITQPYDKITSEMQTSYYEKHPQNYVRLIYGKEADRYQESLDFFTKWMAEGVLVKEDEPAIYPYTQTYKIEGNSNPVTRTGFIAALRLHPYEDKVVLPHERTLKSAREDRFKLYAKTLKDYEQVFMLYGDAERRIEKLLEVTLSGKPLIEATDEYSCIHRVWKVTDQAIIEKAQEVLAPLPVMIADGHHRYETSLALKDHLSERNPDAPGESAFNFRMVTLVNLFDPGLLVLPTHRFVTKLKGSFDELRKKLGDYFEARSIPKFQIQAELKAASKKNAFVLYRKDEALLLVLKNPRVMDEMMPGSAPEVKALDVAVLHGLVIEKLLGVSKEEIESYIKYERYTDKAVESVDSGDYEMVFLMNPTRVDQVESVSKAGEKMPQKSTDFYPKLVSGLVAFDVAPGEVLE